MYIEWLSERNAHFNGGRVNFFYVNLKKKLGGWHTNQNMHVILDQKIAEIPLYWKDGNYAKFAGWSTLIILSIDHQFGGMHSIFSQFLSFFFLGVGTQTNIMSKKICIIMPDHFPKNKCYEIPIMSQLHTSACFPWNKSSLRWWKHS